MLPTTKVCSICKIEKPAESFKIQNRNGKQYLRFACRPCDNKRRYSSPGYAERLKRANVRRNSVAKQHRRDPVNRAKYILKDCKGSDQKKNLVCDLTVQFINDILKDGCVYCGASASQMLLTVDRVDNTIGHLQTNVNAACVRCNDIRKDMPYQAWMMIVPTIREVFQKGMFGDWVGGNARNRTGTASKDALALQASPCP